MCQERYNYRGMNVEFIQRTIEGYGRVEDVIVDGDDDRLIGDTVDRWDFTEVYMNKTFGVTRLSVLRELLERFRRTEPSPENVQDVADALKRLSMEPRSEALRIAVIEQLRRVLR